MIISKTRHVLDHQTDSDDLAHLHNPRLTDHHRLTDDPRLADDLRLTDKPRLADDLRLTDD